MTVILLHSNIMFVIDCDSLITMTGPVETIVLYHIKLTDPSDRHNIDKKNKERQLSRQDIT